MPVIYLTQGQKTIVDSEDFDLADFNWIAQYAKNINNYYAYYSMFINGKTKTVLMHRVILERTLNRALLRGEQIDHINRDTLDNRRSNLRLATISQNQANSKIHANNKSGFKGVRRQGNRWRAKIGYQGKNLHIGYFDTPEEAHKAYCKKAKELFGEFFNPG